MEYEKSDYKEYPKTLAPDDFWGQVRRTVYGKPVSEEQILMIVDAVKKGLDLSSENDVLLDIACGNGALSRYMFDSCKAFLGVDFSEYLINVAKNNFEKLPSHVFKFCEATEYVQSEIQPEWFTKVLCYGSFPFFDVDSAHKLLNFLSKRFVRVRKIYIGNLPDKDCAHKFYPSNKDYSGELNESKSQIGIWRTRAEFKELSKETGWRVIRFHQMPPNFYASSYRYDVILERDE